MLEPTSLYIAEYFLPSEVVALEEKHTEALDYRYR